MAAVKQAVPKQAAPKRTAVKRPALKLAVPALVAAAKPKKISSSERVLPSGLRVLAVRRTSVPMVEVRLRVPFLSSRRHHLARATLLSDAILTGSARYDRLGLAVALQELGADLGVGLDSDRLAMSGSALSNRLADLLDLVADVLATAAYPAVEVAGERDRLAERITMARSQAGTIANEALARRMAPGHPYGLSLPDADDVSAVTPVQLRALHAARVRPGAATLVIVGDVNAEKALDLAEAALGVWTGPAAPSTVGPPAPIAKVPLQVIDRPGSVQTSLRFGGDALGRLDDGYAALQLANLAFGGYFSSRWVENIREDKGYTYSPRSAIDHSVLGSSLTLSADVATEVTGPAMVETLYELGRISTLPITATELESVRQYALGTQSMSTATQAGLASTLSMLLGAGTGIEWLAQHRERLASVTLDEVSEAAATYLAPQRLIGVAVGDAAAITGPLANVCDIEQ